MLRRLVSPLAGRFFAAAVGDARTPFCRAPFNLNEFVDLE